MAAIVVLSFGWLAAADGAPLSLPTGCSQTGQTVTCTYSTAGESTTFTVPAGVRSVAVSAVGGTGGGTGCGTPCGGEGAKVTGSVAVSTGTVLNLQVAGNGSAGGSGGAGGGGSGCGGGGGASSVDSGTSPLVVAAGGGGEGCGGTGGIEDDAAEPGGDAGDPGSQGSALVGTDYIDGKAGQPGTATDPGSAGAGGTLTPSDTGTGGTGGNPGGAGSGGGGGGAGSYTASGGIGGGGGGGVNGGGGGGGGAAESESSGGLTDYYAGSGAGGGGGASLVPSGGNSSLDTTATPSITLVYNVITVTSAAPPAAAVGVPYSYQYTSAGDSDVTWAVTSGTPPAGLSLSSGGAVSGTPTTAGADPYTVTATGATTSATRADSISVIARPIASITAPASGGTYTQGESVDTTFACADASGGPGIASCVDGNRQSSPGGSLDTGTLGPQTYTVTATSEDGSTGTASISYTVVAAPGPQVTIVAPPQPVVGLPTTIAASVIDTSGTPNSFVWTVNGRSAGTGSKITYTFADSAAYHIAVTVGDSEGGHGSASLTVAPVYRRLNVYTPFGDTTVTAPPGAEFTSLVGLAVPISAHVELLCSGRGCPFQRHTVVVRASTKCTTKACKSKKHRATAGTRDVDLTGPLAGHPLAVGARLTIEFSLKSFIGQAQILTVKATGISRKFECLAPGSSTPGRGC